MDGLESTRPIDKANEVQDNLHPKDKPEVRVTVKTWKVNWLDGNSCIVKIWNKLFKKS